MNFEDRTAFSSEGGKSRSGITAMLWSNRSRWGKFGIILMALIMLSTIASLFARFAIIDKYRAADLKVAVIAPLTGDLSGFGLAMKQGAELFIASNQNDPSGSLIVGVEVLDSEGNPQKAAELTKKIAESGEYASVIGGWSGDVVAAIAKEAAANNLPHLAIAPQSLGSTKSSDGTFFLNYTKRDEVRFLANYVRNVQGEKLARWWKHTSF